MYRHLIFGCLFLIADISFGQTPGWAGPDTVSCGDQGVMIGSTEPCPGCCFSWEPTHGLSDATAKNPIAAPYTETTYTVVVTDANLSWKETDEVVVGLSFGELLFIPDHLEQGTEEIVLAKLLNNEDNDPTVWSFSSPDLGCSLVPDPNDHNKATLTAGDQYGKLLVKVRKANNAECFFIDTLPVNNGVKDLRVTDLLHPDRFAMTKDTLWIVGHGDVQLVAIPNEGGFTEGIPNYKPDTYLSNIPEDGIEVQMVSDEQASAPGNFSDYIAGESPDFDPKVTVSRVLNYTDIEDLTAIADGFSNWWDGLFEFDFKVPEIGLGGFQPADDGPCLPLPSPFEPSASCTVTRKVTPVEKYKDRHLGEKEELVWDFSLSLAGRLYYPPLTKHLVWGNVGVCSRFYCGLTLVNSYILSVSRDDSAENSEWKMDNPVIEVGVNAEVRVDFDLLTGTDYNLSAGGAATSGVKAVIGYKIDTDQLFGQLKVSPTIIKVDGKVVNSSDPADQEVIFPLFSKEFLVFEGKDYPEYILYSFEQ